MNFQPNRTFNFRLGTSHFFHRDGYQYETKPVEQGGREYAQLLFFPMAEGYVKALYKDDLSEKDPVAYQYVYIYKDHLGNNRLSYTIDFETGKTKVLEENNYYPFGLKHGNYNAIRKDVKYKEELASKKEIKQVVPEAVKFKYYYQEQERQDELGLNWDSFKYRNYDYAIGRFMSVDPLAEKYPYNATYAFQENKMGLGRELEGLELVYTDSNGVEHAGPFNPDIVPDDWQEDEQDSNELNSEPLPAVEITVHINQDNDDEKNANLTPKGMVDVQPLLQPWDGKIRYKGFGKLKEYGFLGNSTYSIVNGYYLTTQVLLSPLFSKKYENPLTGRKAFVNLDGSPHYKPPVEEYVTTVLPELAETKFFKFSKLNAAEFSSKFKGSFWVRQPHKVRGFFNRSYNFIGAKISNKLTSSSLIEVIKLVKELKKQD